MSIIGMDIGGTNLRIGAVDADRVRDFRRASSGFLAEGDPVKNLIGVIRDYLRDLDAPAPEAIAIGVPASVAPDRKHIYCAPNLKDARGRGCLDGRNLVDPLAEAFGCPVFLDKDVNYLLYCDLVEMRLLHCDSVAACYIGTGFGGALYIGGRLWYGKNGGAMDAGHVSLYNSDAPCNCGKSGCVEAIASGQYLQKLRAACFADTPIDQVFARHAAHPQLRRFLYACAQPPAMLTTFLDPDVLLVGGGVAHMAGFPFEELKELILQSASRVTAAHAPDIRLSPDLAHKGVLGAAYFARGMLS